MDLPDILARKRKIDETEGPIDRITHELFLRDALEVILTELALLRDHAVLNGLREGALGRTVSRIERKV